MITGSFNSLFLFTLIILVHEFGHCLAGILLKWNVYRIEVYPYGGCTKFYNDINKPSIEEFIVLVSGPLLQILFYLSIKNFLIYNDYILFKKYNSAILLFNMMPIYPLDGGRVLNLLFTCFLPYKKSLYFSIYISFFILISIFLIFHKSLTFILVIVFLINKIYTDGTKIGLYYNKFLLERYLNKYDFKKYKIVNSIEKFYKSRRNILNNAGKYYTENESLKKYFSLY